MWQLFTTAAAIIHDKWNLGHGSYSCVPDLQFQIGQRHSCMLAVTYCNEMKQKNKPSEDISFFFFFEHAKLSSKNKAAEVVFSTCSSVFSVRLCHSWRPLHYRRCSVYSIPTDSSSITAALRAHFSDVLYFLSRCLAVHPFPLPYSVTCIASLFACSSHVSNYCTATSIIFFFFIPHFFNIFLPHSSFYRFLTCCSPSPSLHLS